MSLIEANSNPYAPVNTDNLSQRLAETHGVPTETARQIVEGLTYTARVTTFVPALAERVLKDSLRHPLVENSPLETFRKRSP